MNKVADNYILDFPARMSDSRLFTDYRPNCTINYNSFTNSKEEQELKNKTPLQYKYDLIKNGDKYINNNALKMNQLIACNSCPDYNIVHPNIQIDCNKNTCIYNNNGNNGVGMQ